MTTMIEVRNHPKYLGSVVEMWDNNLDHIERDHKISEYVTQLSQCPDLTQAEQEWVRILNHHIKTQWEI